MWKTLLLVLPMATVVAVDPPREPVLSITVAQPILCLARDPGTATSTTVTVTALQMPAGAALTYVWRQVQDEMVPGAARLADKPVALSATDRPDIVATFPASGVYELQVTVSDPKHHLSLTRNTWINVWDPRPALVVDGRPDPLTAIPGMTPPKVRAIAPEPGPFVHPRLLCSPEDWADIHTRAVGGTSRIAASGWRSLRDHARRGVDPTSTYGKFLAEIESHVEAGNTGTVPDLRMGVNDKNPIEQAIAGLLDQLAQASFALWLKSDPRAPESTLPPEDLRLRRQVAQQISGFCRFVLDNSWDRTTGQFKRDAIGYIKNLEIPGERVPDCFSKLALAYDFSAPWMTEEQRRDTRNLLIAVGCGRSGPGYDAGRPPAQNHLARRGFEQNGTFGVWGEPMIWLSLVVAGEEAAADPKVVATFLNPPKPANYEKLPSTPGYDLVKPADADGGGPLPASRPFPPAITWPHARKSDIAWLQKEIFTFQDEMLSPWGFTLEREAYFGYIANEAWPVAYTFARFGGFNQFVGCHYYQTVDNWIYTMYPSAGVVKSDSFASNVGIYEHHSGGGDYRQQWILFLKHMYPEDPVVDYAYAAQAPELERRSLNPIHSCIFGVDPRITDLASAMEPVGIAHRLPLTKLDPRMGIAVMRSGWKDDDLMLYLSGGHPVWGHMNAEHGSFAFFALGRHWSVPSGYHKVLGNFQSLVQVQNPAWAACTNTEGYMTENPCLKPDVRGCDYVGGFPTPSAHLLEVREAPDQAWSLAATDMTLAYDFTCGNPTVKPQSFELRTLMYPGLPDFLTGIDPAYASGKASFFPVPEGCRLRHVIRTVLVVRGPRPYALVVDDVRKDDAPANYRWVMNDKIRQRDEGREASKDDASFCVTLAPGATATDAVLLHRRDQGDQPGLPRLLVRDVSEDDRRGQPAIRQEQRVFKLPEEKYNREETNAVVIERQQVVEPHFKILLFPYRTGEAPPVTAWDADRQTLRIDLRNGTRHAIRCDGTNPDHRTRLTWAPGGDRGEKSSH